MINEPFVDCKNDALHLADSIQAFGVMLVVDGDNRICAVSANTGTLLGEPPETFIDQEWNRVLPDDELALPELTSEQDPLLKPLRLQAFSYRGRSLLAAVHQQGEHRIIELEPAPQGGLRSGAEAANLARGMADLAAGASAEKVAEALMQAVARITGYDRVLLYQFMPDLHGKVIAEVLSPHVDSLMGHHFPAGDIPDNARRLYERKFQRVIVDVHAEPVPLLGNRQTSRLDLTFSELRAVHPVHVEYLKNMGVAASFSVSVVVEGTLWGLIACHNFSPLGISFNKRQLCEQLATIASMRMGDLQRLTLEHARHDHGKERSLVKLALQKSERGGKNAIVSQLARIYRAFNAGGVWACLGGHHFYRGGVPNDDDLAALKRWLSGFEHDRVLARDFIDAGLQDRPSLVRLASGLLYIPLNENDFLVLFRAELREEVTWAGKPPEARPGEAETLTPRASFEAWVEQTVGHAAPWHRADLEAADLLRAMLIEHLERIHLERLALTDPLTGLYNRAMFDQKLREAANGGFNATDRFTVLMLDLDRFKPVNDEYGHAAGDLLLQMLAKRLTSQLREGDLVARLGGDEFVVLQFNQNDTDAVHVAAERILASVRQPYDIQGRKILIGASMGAAFYPQHGTKPGDLLERADMALYQVKGEGRNGFCLFNPELLQD